MSAFLTPKIHLVGDVSSTMDVVREMLAASPSDTEPFAVLAESQSSGRGTTGRQWSSPRGNMYFSLCLPTTLVAAEFLPVLPLATGLACRAAIMELVEGAVVHVKWPNDIIYDGKKIGGSIAECEGEHLIVGIGINIEVAPPVPDGGRPSYAVNSIASVLGKGAVTPQLLAEAVWRNFFSAVADQGFKRPELIKQFEAAMDKSLVLHKRTPTGRDPMPLHALKLNEWGHLVVGRPDGSEEVLVAEYLF
ncbi:Biotin--acetyl-CoA-carboxylase ligase, putative [Trypanosoma equiperdum]|uniref:Biotin--acetyl-CoA-carboxylase ligase, putative n=3 Tax=Trypanozoon TaxID=39700 RepID=Q383S3_TRYB2|nr:biotin--acetyl-CoA-carboxylase ligase, putative [Trypanosoma brucei brucei TREU927]EAN79958.1 biotin--acetyl-CoA-carboxylase ligase, putative [Trypanosoma brucei brucei TREU927]RHW68022.1 Biotin--acetyl-CoA-carboxylase ligase [Trypanosoma brucei equiperdum]SCU72753.1 Biotin--acetyl-CoA-carboxylase ligase, putative [Trypanosoma equiperdum]